MCQSRPGFRTDRAANPGVDVNARLFPPRSRHRPIGLPVTDQTVSDTFDKIYRRGQMEVKSRLQGMQDRLKTPHSVVAGMVMTLVKASPEVQNLRCLLRAHNFGRRLAVARSGLIVWRRTREHAVSHFTFSKITPCPCVTNVFPLRGHLGRPLPLFQAPASMMLNQTPFRKQWAGDEQSTRTIISPPWSFNKSHRCCRSAVGFRYARSVERP